MKFARVFASAAILAVAAAGAGRTANLRNADEPAEFPPVSYRGQQYVDSRGCIYIRAGIDGNVTWVPRVTRGRKHICGYKPTFAKPVAKDLPVIADASVKPVKPAKPAAKAAAAPKPVKTVRKATPKPVKVVRKAAPKPKPSTNRAPMKTVASIPARPRMVKPVRSAPQARPAAKPAAAPVRRSPAVTSCQGVSAIGRKHMAGSGLRCGPQTESPVGRTARGSAKRAPVQAAAAPAPRTVRIKQAAVTAKPGVLSGRVYDNPPATIRRTAAPLPKGYRPVWQDDRLNPYRGNRTINGRAQMDLVWTQTVPRQLIDRDSGRDVTRLHPNLRYPFTDLTTQVRTDAQAASARVSAKSAGVVSTKSRAPVKADPAAQTAAQSSGQSVGKSYVQVGTFGIADNARATALRLKRAGLPARIWTTKRKGKDYQIVVAGPFANGTGAQAALGTVRKAGFRDAFLRR